VNSRGVQTTDYPEAMLGKARASARSDFGENDSSLSAFLLSSPLAKINIRSDMSKMENCRRLEFWAMIGQRPVGE